MTFIFKSIANVLRMFWRLLSFIRATIANLLLLAVILLLVALFNRDAEPPLPQQAALHLPLSGRLVEQRSTSVPLRTLGQQLLGSDAPIKEIELGELVYAIKQAAADPRITGIVMEPDNLVSASQVMLSEVGSALQAFRDSGKPVYALANHLTQNQYYLASFADQILLNPAGAVMLHGYQNYPLYFKSALERLQVSTHVFRVGTYKAAVEPFIRNDMSPEAKQASAAWVNQLWQAYISQVASNRGIPPGQVLPPYREFQQGFAEVDGDLAAYAHHAGLVNGLLPAAGIRTRLQQAFGAEASPHGYQRIDYAAYVKALPDRFHGGYQSDQQIGLIVASGPIMDGIQPAGTIGGESTADLLRQARLDERIKAVVLRLDTPGGSAFASEQIGSQLQALRDAGKPVVVSMGTLAASGGYWIAAYADTIVAAPTTITGSIGIFGMFATFEDSLAAIGIHSDGVSTTPWTSVNPARPLPEETAAVIQQVIEHGYRRFTGLVAANRDLPLAEVQALAEGRVWTGADALRLGLVDQLGTLDDAIAVAANAAGVDSEAVVPVTLPISPGQQLLRQVFGSSGDAIASALLQRLGLSSGRLPPAVQAIGNQLEPLLEHNDPQGMYAQCLTCVRL